MVINQLNLLDICSLSVLDPSVLTGQTKTFHILFITMSRSDAAFVQCQLLRSLYNKLISSLCFRDPNYLNLTFVISLQFDYC